MKYYLLLLLPMLAFADPDPYCEGNPHHCTSDGTVLEQYQDQAQDQHQNQSQDQYQDQDQSQTQSQANSQTTSFEASPPTAYAYAAQCGTAGGVGTNKFSSSVSGESQYCKHLRVAAMYEGLFLEAKSRNDNYMAQLWYNGMSGELASAQSLINSTSWTGAAKEVSSDLLLPVGLCGGIAVAGAGVAGVVCAVGVAVKATIDTRNADKANKETKRALEVIDTNFTPKRKIVECTYVDGILSHNEYCVDQD